MIFALLYRRMRPLMPPDILRHSQPDTHAATADTFRDAELS
jgi:hypothetical protein